MTASMITTTRQEAALIRNDQPWPTAWISTPERAGPTSAPNWNTEELRLTALRTCRLPTNSATNTWRVGLSTDRDETEQGGDQVDVPDLCRSGQREESQQGRQGCGSRLGDHQQGALGVAVGEQPTDQAEDQHRQELQGDGYADRGDTPAQLQDQPVLRDPLHPQSGGRNRLRAEVEPIVPYGPAPPARAATGDRGSAEREPLPHRSGREMRVWPRA